MFIAFQEKQKTMKYEQYFCNCVNTELFFFCFRSKQTKQQIAMEIMRKNIIDTYTKIIGKQKKKKKEKSIFIGNET
jgi:hypothetical protein